LGEIPPITFWKTSMKTYDDFIKRFGPSNYSVIYCELGKVVITSDVVKVTTDFRGSNWENSRLDGPVFISKDIDENGKNITEWYINGFHVDNEIRAWAKENDIDLDNLSEDDKLLIKLVWSDYGK